MAPCAIFCASVTPIVRKFMKVLKIVLTEKPKKRIILTYTIFRAAGKGARDMMSVENMDFVFRFSAFVRFYAGVIFRINFRSGR